MPRILQSLDSYELVVQKTPIMPWNPGQTSNHLNYKFVITLKKFVSLIWRIFVPVFFLGQIFLFFTWKGWFSTHGKNQHLFVSSFIHSFVCFFFGDFFSKNQNNKNKKECSITVFPFFLGKKKFRNFFLTFESWFYSL